MSTSSPFEVLMLKAVHPASTPTDQLVSYTLLIQQRLLDVVISTMLFCHKIGAGVASMLDLPEEILVMICEFVRLSPSERLQAYGWHARDGNLGSNSTMKISPTSLTGTTYLDVTAR